MGRSRRRLKKHAPKVCMFTLKAQSDAILDRHTRPNTAAHRCPNDRCHAALQLICYILPQVRVGVVKRSKKLKAPVPKVIATQYPALATKLHLDCSWETSTTPSANYKHNGLLNEPNGLKVPGTDAAAPDNGAHYKCMMCPFMCDFSSLTVTQLCLQRNDCYLVC